MSGSNRMTLLDSMRFNFFKITTGTTITRMTIVAIAMIAITALPMMTATMKKEKMMATKK